MVDSEEVLLTIILNYNGKEYSKKSLDFISYKELKIISKDEFKIPEEDLKYIEFQFINNKDNKDNKSLFIKNDNDIMDNLTEIDEYNYEIKLNISIDKSKPINEEEIIELKKEDNINSDNIVNEIDKENIDNNEVNELKNLVKTYENKIKELENKINLYKKKENERNNKKILLEISNTEKLLYKGNSDKYTNFNNEILSLQYLLDEKRKENEKNIIIYNNGNITYKGNTDKYTKLNNEILSLNKLLNEKKDEKKEIRNLFQICKNNYLHYKGNTDISNSLQTLKKENEELKGENSTYKYLLNERDAINIKINNKKKENEDHKKYIKDEFQKNFNDLKIRILNLMKKGKIDIDINNNKPNYKSKFEEILKNIEELKKKTTDKPAEDLNNNINKYNKNGGEFSTSMGKNNFKGDINSIMKENYY